MRKNSHQYLRKKRKMLGKLKKFEELMYYYIQKEDVASLYRLRNKIYYVDSICTRSLTTSESEIKKNILKKITEYVFNKKIEDQSMIKKELGKGFI